MLENLGYFDIDVRIILVSNFIEHMKNLIDKISVMILIMAGLGVKISNDQYYK